MKLRIGINGFGRIGRMVCRQAVEHPDLEVVAINASYPAETLAHLLRYDTVHGRFDLPVSAEADALVVGGHRIRLVSDRTPANLPWRDLGVDLVVEATGKFRGGEGARGHLVAGARKVIITAPAKGEVDATLVYGVNHEAYDPERHHLISAASCTTTALAPLAKVLHREFGILGGLMTTVHAYTNDQNLVDNPHKDLRRARAATLSIIPTTTGAAQAVGLVLPELQGKLTGFALRVPTPDVSVVDLTVRLARPATTAEVNAVLRAAAEGEMRGIIGYSEEPLVSSDYIGDSRSCIVDGLSTLAGPEGLVKVVAWYDNEWGYSARVVDLCAHIARVGVAGAVAAG
ncbi:MAG: type I glyceraldehyde-3-phosphate dehydrogenase [Bacillota bacterium]|nr:MAG: type I glyceraldehyde-3-phosphate dehydrogenase [Bacillota bacterium]